MNRIQHHSPPKVGKQHFCKHYHSAKNDAGDRSRREVRLAFWRTWVNLRGIGKACANRLHHSPSADAKVLSIASKASRKYRQQPKQMHSRKNARSAYPWLMMRPKGTHTSAKSQVAIAHKQLLTSCFKIGYALRAFSCEVQAPPRIAGGFLGAATRALGQIPKSKKKRAHAGSLSGKGFGFAWRYFAKSLPSK